VWGVWGGIICPFIRETQKGGTGAQGRLSGVMTTITPLTISSLATNSAHRGGHDTKKRERRMVEDMHSAGRKKQKKKKKLGGGRAGKGSGMVPGACYVGSRSPGKADLRSSEKGGDP